MGPALATADIPVQVITILLQTLSIGWTLIRLVHRWRASRMWWDDKVAILALVADVTFLVVFFGSQSHPNVFLSNWMITSTFFMVIWFSRMSLALSIARVFPPKHTCRRIAFVLAGFFGIVCVVLLSTAFGECYDPHIAWYTLLFNQCAMRKSGGIASMYTFMGFDVIADMSLVILPVAMLWKVKLPPNQRRLVLFLFSSSTLSLLAMITYLGVFLSVKKLGRNFPLAFGLVTHILVAVSLFVCNLLVVTMLFYRMLKRRDLAMDDESSSPNPSPLPAGSDARETSQIHSSTNNVQTSSSELDSISKGTESIVLTSIIDDSFLSSVRGSSNPQFAISFSPHSNNSDPSPSPPIPQWSFSERSRSVCGV